MADPIERLGVELEIYGIPQPAGSPPMTDSYLHVRRRQDGAGERAVMGLPAYKGEQGIPGPPGAVHQGERTTAQLDALALLLNADNTNWAYRNTDTDDQYVWTGETFVIYQQVYATPGPVGPPPDLSPGSLTVGGTDYPSGDYGVRVTGSAGQYALGLDLPAPPQGDKGDPGASGSIYESVDVAEDSTRNDGDVLMYSADDELLHWSPGGYWIEEYVVPPSGFPNVSKGVTDSRHVMFTVTIPAKTFAYRFDFTGGVDVSSFIGTQIDMEIRCDDATAGPVVGYGKGQDGEGFREVAFRAHSDVAIDPSTRAGIVEPGTEVILYASAVKVSGILTGWRIRNDNAQLRIRLLRVPT